MGGRGGLRYEDLDPPIPCFWGWGPGQGPGLTWGCQACLSPALTEAAAKEEEAKDNPEKGHDVRLSRGDGVCPRDPQYIALAHQS